jgi:hypothetical protein
MKQKHNRLLWWSSCLLFILLVNNNASKAQLNYIPNPSFEQLKDSVKWNSYVDLANPWLRVKVQGNACLYSKKHSYKNYLSSAPCNKRDRLCKYPRTGDTYCILTMYEHAISAFDTLQRAAIMTVPLKSVLTANSNYCITFYIGFTARAQIAVKNIDVYLSQDTIACPSWVKWLIQPAQIRYSPASGYLADSVNWVKCQMNYTAQGNEQYLSLGQMSPMSMVDTIQGLGWGSLYYSDFFADYGFDDISLIASNSQLHLLEDTLIYQGDSVLLGRSAQGLPIEWYDIQGQLLGNSSSLWVSPLKDTRYIARMDLCGEVSQDTVSVFVEAKPDGISSHEINTNVRVYPNPSSDMLYVQVSETNCLIEMYDSYGRQIVVNAKDANTSEALHVFNLKTLATGVYFIRVKSAKDEVIAVGSFVKE